MRWIPFALVPVLLTATLAATPPEPYELHAIVEQTGTFAFFGGKQAEAYRAIEGFVNETGGIRGRPVRFVMHDDQSNPQVAVQIANQLIAEQVPVIFGPALSATCLALLPLVQQSGPVELCTSPLITPPARGYVFRGAPNTDDYQPVIIRYFLGRRLKKIAMITSTDASGDLFDQKMTATLNLPEFRDAKLVSREHFNPTDINVGAQVAQIKAAQPDVVVTFTAGTATGTVFRGLSDAGMDVPVFASGTNMNLNQLQQYAAFLPKDLIFNGSTGLTEETTIPPAVKLQRANFFKAMSAAGIRPEAAHIFSWDLSMAAIEALRSLGPSATAEGVHNYMERLRRFAGVEGIYDFTTGDQAGIGQSAVALFRYVQAKSSFELITTGQRQ